MHIDFKRVGIACIGKKQSPCNICCCILKTYTTYYSFSHGKRRVYSGLFISVSVTKYVGVMLKISS